MSLNSSSRCSCRRTNCKITTDTPHVSDRTISDLEDRTCIIPSICPPPISQTCPSPCVLGNRNCLPYMRTPVTSSSLGHSHARQWQICIIPNQEIRPCLAYNKRTCFTSSRPQIPNGGHPVRAGRWPTHGDAAHVLWHIYRALSLTPSLSKAPLIWYYALQLHPF